MDLVPLVLDVFLAFFVLLSLAGWFSFNFVAFFIFCESSDFLSTFFVLLSLAGWFSFNFVAFFIFCESSDFLSTTLGIPGDLAIAGVEDGVKDVGFFVVFVTVK